MQKIFINKETDLVEQILKEEEGEYLTEDYFSNCYMVEDIEENIKGYNLRYNKKEEVFEVVEGLPAMDKVEIFKQPTTEDYNALKEENKELKDRLDNIENLIKQISGVE